MSTDMDKRLPAVVFGLVISLATGCGGGAA